MAAALDALDVAALSDDDLTDAMAAWRRLTSWAQSQELVVVAELVRRREEQYENAPAVKLGEFIADEIALALTLSGGTAGMWAGLASKLADRLPLTRRALAKGHIDLARARVIADGLLDVDAKTAALVERAVLDEAQVITTGRLRHRLREVIKAVDPEAAEQRRRRAHKVRSLEKWATVAGTCELAFREMSEDDAEVIYNRINAAAQAMKADGDVRPIDAIRHDLGVALLRGTPLPDAARDLHHSADGDEAAARPMARHDGIPAGQGRAGQPAGPTRPTGAPDLGTPNGPWPSGFPPPSEDPPNEVPPSEDPPSEDPPRAAEESGRPDGPSRAHSRSRAASSNCRSAAADHGAAPGHGETPGHRRSPRVGRDDEPGEHYGRAVTDAAVKITGLLAEVIDERLDSAADRHRRTGRHTGLALRIAAALQTMSNTLADAKSHWCQTVTGHVSTDLTTGAQGRQSGSGHPDRHGHDGYRPPAAMRRMIEHAYRVCAFPTCERPVQRCDLDHTVAWQQGGSTCSCNLSPLCRRHHRLKQHPQWHLFQPWPGLLVWVAPSGKWHTVIPEDRQ
ncbi:DUF222 domain-containing protein [Actinomadura scrupuli]|uniref:HNH endonuclease signature motif containing protein n=1 Tax=Actinomadura scrupuli TaxID=559629 RepID=UPI003D958FE1